jgi:nuclear transport factor 2 (NTF2) superfamily protein
MNDNRPVRWLSLIANLGALIGLLLIVVQLRQNRDLMRAEIRHDLAMGIVDLLNVPAADAQLASVLRRGALGEALTPDEQFQFELRTNALLRYWEDVHYQYRQGLYDEVEFSAQKEAWSATSRQSAGLAAYWCRVRELYSPEFMAELDALQPPDACRQESRSMLPADLPEFAARYTEAWSSRDPSRVASFFSEKGVLRINEGEPSVGRAEITATARSFMTALPDLSLVMDSLGRSGDRVTYHWTLTGTNTGPGGTGNAVHISGFEEWLFGSDQLIQHSQGHMDEEDYARQLEVGIEDAPPGVRE